MTRTYAKLVGLTLLGLLGLVACTLSLSLLLGFPPTGLQDWMDERALRRHFRIPSGFERLYYDGYPSMVGFGQREGLEISAGYRLTEAEQEAFLRDGSARGWQPLPIPEGVRSKIPFEGLRMPMEAKAGVFLCQTAGNEVLHATVTQSCASVSNLPDLILGVLDTDRHELHVVVRAGY